MAMIWAIVAVAVAVAVVVEVVVVVAVVAVVVVIVVVAAAVVVVVAAAAVVVVVVFLVPHTTFSMPLATNWCPRVTFFWLLSRKPPLVPYCYKLFFSCSTGAFLW